MMSEVAPIVKRAVIDLAPSQSIKTNTAPLTPRQIKLDSFKTKIGMPEHEMKQGIGKMHLSTSRPSEMAMIMSSKPSSQPGIISYASATPETFK